MDLLKSQLHNLCESFWQWRLANFPEFATIAGFHKYDDKLNDLSLDGIKKRKFEAMSFLEDALNLMKLYEENDINICADLELLKSQLETFIHGLEHRAYLCPINRSEGPQFDLPRVIGQMKKENVEDFTKILTRLSLLPKQVDQIIELMKEGISAKVTLHEHSITPVPSQLKMLINEPFWNSPLTRSFQNCPNNLKNEDWELIIDGAKTIIGTRVVPSLSKLADFITFKYMQHTRPDISVSSLPKGKAFYEACLCYHTSTTLTAENIHELGKNEVERIHKCMHAVKNQMNFSGTINEFKRYLNRVSYENGEDVMNDYTNICKRIWKQLPKVFATLPNDKCLLKPVPKEQQQVSPSAFYKEGNENRAGVFYVNTHNANTRVRYKSMALCLHEAIPGHHLQSDVFLHKKYNEKFRRFIEGGNYQMIPGRFPLYTAFMEGWGLYAEYLGEEMDLYDNAYDLFGRLLSEMLRASRLVVDTGIHAFHWSKEQSIEYMIKYTGLTHQFVSSEIDRYITWPGQACSYKIGEMKFREMRNKAMNALGENFDVREFHEILLRNGAVPMDFVEKNIKNYILSKVSH